MRSRWHSEECYEKDCPACALPRGRLFGTMPCYQGLNLVNFRVPESRAARSATSVRLNYLNRPSIEVTVAVQ